MRLPTINYGRQDTFSIGATCDFWGVWLSLGWVFLDVFIERDT